MSEFGLLISSCIMLVVFFIIWRYPVDRCGLETVEIKKLRQQLQEDLKNDS